MNNKTYIGNFDGQDLWYYKGTYPNGRTAIELVDENDEPYAVMTINLPLADCPEHMVHLNADMTQELVDFLRKKNIIGDAIDTVQYNYGHYELCPLFI